MEAIFLVSTMRNKLAAALVFLSAFTADLFAVTIIANITITDDGGMSALTVGQTMTLTFVTLPGLGLPNFNEHPNSSHWRYESNGDPPIWSTVTGSALSGTWTDTPNGTDPYSEIRIDRDIGDGRLSLIAGTDSGQGIGLFAGSDELSVVILSMDMPSGAIPSWPGVGLGTLEAVLPSGTFTPSFTVDGRLITINNPERYTFEVDSISFFAGSVPEPSRSLCLLAGMVAVLSLRRRANSRAWHHATLER